jgi:LPXTG-motif cell wall-anchored protein
MNTFDLTHALRDVRTNSVIAICLLIKRDCKMFPAMACLCVLLGGPSYAAGATYYEPGVSGPGWAWTDADHLELDGYAGEAIGAEGDLVLTLAGQNSVAESHAPDADITLCGMEAWGNLTLRGTGTLTATGSQCGIHVSQVLVVDGCTVDVRADGADITDEAVAGVIAGDMAVRGGGRVVAAGAGSGACVRAYGVYLQDAGIGDGSAGCRLSVDASWLDAAGADGGVACTGGSLVSARFVAPAGGTFDAGGVVDASGAVAPHVVIEPDVAMPPAGETDRGEVPGDSTDNSPADASPAVGEPTTGPTANPALKPATATTKTTTTVTKTAVAKIPKPKAATTATAALPKTGDSNWIAASFTLLLLGLGLLGAAYRCWSVRHT